MTRAEDAKLAQFCAAQYWRFSAAEWVATDERWRAQLATAAYFLGTTYGFGHEVELLAVADRLQPGLASDFEAFRTLIDQTGFDPSRFHDMLQAEIDNAVAHS